MKIEAGFKILIYSILMLQIYIYIVSMEIYILSCMLHPPPSIITGKNGDDAFAPTSVYRRTHVTCNFIKGFKD